MPLPKFLFPLFALFSCQQMCVHGLVAWHFIFSVCLHCFLRKPSNATPCSQKKKRKPKRRQVQFLCVTFFSFRCTVLDSTQHKHFLETGGYWKRWRFAKISSFLTPPDTEGQGSKFIPVWLFHSLISSGFQNRRQRRRLWFLFVWY